jgi:hypothetical protein
MISSGVSPSTAPPFCHVAPPVICPALSCPPIIHANIKGVLGRDEGIGHLRYKADVCVALQKVPHIFKVSTIEYAGVCR